MVRNVGDFAHRLATTLKLDKAAGWDPVGLQLGDPTAPLAKVAVCHEVTPAVVDQLLRANVDMVVTYHPLLFRPVTSIVAGNSPAGRAHSLISAGIALAVVHTAYDVLPGGTADALAAAIGVENVTGFGPVWGRDTVKVVTFAPTTAVDSVAAAMAEAGAGRIGGYSSCSFRVEGIGAFLPGVGTSPNVGITGALNRETEIRLEMICPAARLGPVVAALVHAHPYEEPAYDVIDTKSNAGFVGRRGSLAKPLSVAELAERVAAKLGGVLRVAGAGTVSSVAVVPGSGGSFIGDAATDVVVTGDVSHHQARDAMAAGVAVIDPGHAATERPGVKALYAAVAEIVHAVDMTEIDNDPWKER